MSLEMCRNFMVVSPMSLQSHLRPSRHHLQLLSFQKVDQVRASCGWQTYTVAILVNRLPESIFHEIPVLSFFLKDCRFGLEAAMTRYPNRTSQRRFSTRKVAVELNISSAVSIWSSPRILAMQAGHSSGTDGIARFEENLRLRT